MADAKGNKVPGATARTWVQRLVGSRYFLYAVLFHVGILAILGGHVIMEKVLPPKVFEGGTILVSSPVPPPPTTKIKSTESKSNQNRSVDGRDKPMPLPPSPEILTGGNNPNERSSLPGPVVNVPPPLAPPDVGPREPTHVPDIDRLTKVRDFLRPLDVSGSGTSTHATFTCFLARYQDGDWNCNEDLDSVVPGSLRNMLTQIVRWSSKNIQASVQPKAVSVGSDEIFKLHPPFLFLTGHKDFHFTEDEVRNLREYLLLGGAVWGDNALPGRHSRFDEAFRREMKRVLPDHEFTVVPKNHGIYNCFFPLGKAPAGMNYYSQPVEQMTIGDELAVVYTLNDYSDLWQTGLNEDNKIDNQLHSDTDTGISYYRWGTRYGSFLYRNVTDESILQANQLAVNIVVHLLTRYQDKFLLIGKSTTPGYRL